MATKSFKVRVSKLITTTFDSCRSKDPSTLPHDPVPTFFRLSPVSPKLLTIDHYKDSPKNSGSSSVRRHVSSAFSSIGCGFTSTKPAAIKHSDDNRTRSSSQQEFSWEQEDKWHVVAKIYDDKRQAPRRKIYDSSASGDSGHDEKILALPPLPPPPPSKKKRRGKKKRAPPARLRASTSSAESGLFSSEGGEVILEEDDEDDEEESLIETETLISSSRSFSTDDSSSEFNPNLEPIRETPLPISRRHKRTSKKKNKKHSTKRGVSRTTIYRPSSVSSAAENESPARLSVFKKLIPCSVDGKVKESFAIVKKSEDPYEDFKRSMMEMILEKQMFEERDLEQLLQCFLSLNSRHYHGLIIEVFAEIWEAMFCATDDHRSSNGYSHRRRRGVNSRNTNSLRV